MKKVITSVSGFALVAIAQLLLLGASVSAQGSIHEGAAAAHGTGTPTMLFGGTGVITNITNILLFLIGALAVIMIIWGGFRYATSAGNAASVTAAKNTIMYAIIGLIIAFLAFAIVNWVLGALSPGSTSGFTDV